TILTNLVGRSVVSAITQTPASGPFRLVTMPPRSLSPTLTPAGAVCCALRSVDEDSSSAPSETAASVRSKPALRFIVRSSNALGRSRHQFSAPADRGAAGISPCLAVRSPAPPPYRVAAKAGRKELPARQLR